MKYGLSEEQFTEIIDIISTYPEIESAIIFGSRATGSFRRGSDIDIAILGNEVDYNLLLGIKGRFEDSDLPFFLDIIAYSIVESEDLKKNINEQGKVIYKR